VAIIRRELLLYPLSEGGQVLNAGAGKGTGNNYAYLLVDEKTKNAAIIDPANPVE
jgi:glyoxylase-like metal-dependent hydrolase (beta-lactamase superfamily II)